MRDLNGESTTLTRATNSVTVTVGDGRALVLDLDATGRVVTMSGPGGRTVGYRYNAAGDLINPINFDPS